MGYDVVVRASNTAFRYIPPCLNTERLLWNSICSGIAALDMKEGPTAAKLQEATKSCQSENEKAGRTCRHRTAHGTVFEGSACCKGAGIALHLTDHLAT